MLRYKLLKYTLFVFILLLLLQPAITYAYIDGGTFIKNYSEKNYNAHAQNSYIVQDKKGIIFFANNDCVLNFDGINWESTYLPNIAHVFAVAVSDKGTLYAAGQNELGYLKYDHQGKFVYESLLPLISEKNKDFSDIFDIVCVDSTIYFLSEERLFIYNQQKILCIEPSKDGVFRALFKVKDKVYVNDKNLGLEVIENNRLIPLKANSNLGEVRIKAMFDLQNKLLACTGQNEFIEIAPNANQKLLWFDLPAKNDLIVRTAIKLKNGNICLGSKNNGILIFNTKGEILAKYNVENGLINNSVWYIYEDLQNNIWVATDKGISFIETSANLKKIKSNDLSGVNLNSILQYQSNLYLGTSQSLLKLSQSNNKINETKLSEEIEPFHHILIFDNKNGSKQLLGATDHGVINVVNDKILYIDEEGDFPVLLLSASKYHPKLLFAAGVGKIYIYKFENNVWKRIHTFDLQGESVISFAEPKPGVVWAGTIRNNYFEFNYDIDKINQFSISKKSLQLKKEIFTRTLFFELNNQICVDSDSGIYRYTNGTWSKQGYVEGLPTDVTFGIFKILKADQHRMWIMMINEAGNINCGLFYNQKNTSRLIWSDKFLKRFYNFPINSIAEVGNSLWLASNDGLFYFDMTQEKQTGNFEYNTLIKNIHLLSSNLFYQSKNWRNKLINDLPEIQYKNNQIRFEFTATNFVESDKIKFSSKLIPFDKDYTNWSLERVREFTNLAEGTYTFKVKSMDIYGNVGKEDEFSFTILPPWYRTWWAYGLFIIVAVLIGVGLVKFNTRRLKKQNQLLEATVINRTQEIEKQKNEIEEINREVTDSIRYAQMIQNSILPLANDLKKVVPDSFIFYKPRDIVSGDFYWIHEIPEENRIFVAAADCTGHGVPGAFMSMMGMEKLNQSVKVLSKVNPSKILSYLNKEIKLTLGKHINERELRDGMEIALIDIKLNENKISFAGANRPLWIVSPGKDAEEIEVIKPTKAGIAGFTEFDQVFEENTIQIEKGQSIYLFTDGAIDQFGGPHGKKIMTKGLKKFINDIQAASLEKQHALVANYFEEWQGAHEQVDDILIIGLRLEA
jgi:serine phosphatase RsbU (regulator of sigma subunit)